MITPPQKKTWSPVALPEAGKPPPVEGDSEISEIFRQTICVCLFEAGTVAGPTLDTGTQKISIEHPVSRIQYQETGATPYGTRDFQRSKYQPDYDKTG